MLCALRPPLAPRPAPADPIVTATVFAPTNAALESLLAGLKVTFDQLLQDQQLVEEVGDPFI